MSKYAQLLTELIRIQVERNIILKEMEDILGFDVSFSDEELRKHAIELLEKRIVEDISKEIRGF
jgi:deoxyinosine 3'endonuclease (endonuclease V)|tara:strand:- start:370 stop:561 length:192 start_codon:yes stop_codon:yes gene_type:complete